MKLKPPPTSPPSTPYPPSPTSTPSPYKQPYTTLSSSPALLESQSHKTANHPSKTFPTGCCTLQENLFPDNRMQLLSSSHRPLTISLLRYSRSETTPSTARSPETYTSSIAFCLSRIQFGQARKD